MDHRSPRSVAACRSQTVMRRSSGHADVLDIRFASLVATTVVDAGPILTAHRTPRQPVSALPLRAIAGTSVKASIKLEAIGGCTDRGGSRGGHASGGAGVFEPPWVAIHPAPHPGTASGAESRVTTDSA